MRAGLNRIFTSFVAPNQSGANNDSSMSLESTKIDQVSSFINQGIIDVDDENDSDASSDSSKNHNNHGRIQTHSSKPLSSSSGAISNLEQQLSGTLSDHLHKIASRNVDFDDNESEESEEYGTNLGSESAQSDDVHSVHEFDETDMGNWLSQKYNTSSKIRTSDSSGVVGIAVKNDSLSLSQAIEQNSDVLIHADNSDLQDATSLFLSNLEESDDEDVPNREGSSISRLNSRIDEASSNLNPFLLHGSNSSDDDDDDDDDSDRNYTQSTHPIVKNMNEQQPLSHIGNAETIQVQSSKDSNPKVRFNDESNLGSSKNQEIESTIDSTTQELLLHSVRRAQSFVKDTLDIAPKTSLSPTPSFVSNTEINVQSAASHEIVEIIKAKVEMDPLAEIDLPSKEDVDDLFRDANEMRSHLEHELKRIDAESKFLESQLQLLVDTRIPENDVKAEKELREQYEVQKQRLKTLESLRIAEINQQQVRLLKIREVAQLMHQESILARNQIFDEENKTKAFHAHYYHLTGTIDQVHLNHVVLERERKLQNLFDWSQEVVTRLEGMGHFEKDFAKIRERYEGLIYFIPDLHINNIIPQPPPPPQPSSSKVTQESILSVSVSESSYMDSESSQPSVLTPKATIAKSVSQRMSIFQPPPAAESSVNTIPSGAADSAMIVPKKRLKEGLGALVNEVLVRRGSACPYGVPPKRHSESNLNEITDPVEKPVSESIENHNFEEASKATAHARPVLLPLNSPSVLKSIFSSTDDSRDNAVSTWPTNGNSIVPNKYLNVSITPFSPIESATNREMNEREFETESVITTDDRHTPVLDSSMSKLAQKRLSLSDRKKSRSSMSGLGSPVVNSEAIRVVTSLTKSLKKKYTSDNLADLVAMSRAAHQSVPDPTSSPEKTQKRNSLPKTPEKEELPELESVLDLPEVPLSAIPVPLKKIEVVESAGTKPPIHSMGTAMNPAPKLPMSLQKPTVKAASSAAVKLLLEEDDDSSNATSQNSNSPVQPRLDFTKLDARTASPMSRIREDEIENETGSKKMKYFYQGVLDTVGDGIRSGVLRVFRIMELALVSSMSSSANSGAANNSSQEHKFESYRNSTLSLSNPGGKRRSSVTSVPTNVSSSGTRNTLISNALTQRRKAANMHSSEIASELSPSNDSALSPSIANGNERPRTYSKDGTSPDKSMPKTHVNILPQVAFFDTRTLLDTLAQKTISDTQLKHHAMVMLSNTLHLNNIDDMLVHVRALQEAHSILVSNDAELVNGKLWDISQLFQAARVLIHLFGTETAHGRSSATGTVADHEHALTLDAAAAYQTLRNLKEELQRCLLLQNAALSAKSSRASFRRASLSNENISSTSPRTSIIRGSLLIAPNNHSQPLTVTELIAESEGLRAQMISQLLPHNMSAAELMVRLLTFRDGLFNQSRQYKSLGRREIYRFLKKFGFAIEQQLDIDVHAQNMQVGSSAKPVANQISTALEELDKVEQETKVSNNVIGNNNSTNDSVALANSLASTFPQSNPVLLNKLQQQQALATGSNHTNQTNAGRFCLDRMRTLVLHSDELLHRMRIMKETLLSLAANDSDSNSEYEDDDDDDERGNDFDQVDETSSAAILSVSQYSGIGASGQSSQSNLQRSNAKRPLSNRMRRARDKFNLDRAMQEVSSLKDDLKKRVATMMTSTMSEDVDILIKSHVTTEEGLANRLFDATFRKEDSSIAVLLLRSRNIRVLRSIYATWPGLIFEIAIPEPPLSVSSQRNGNPPLLNSPSLVRSSSQLNNTALLRSSGNFNIPIASPSLVSARAGTSPNRFQSSVHPGIAGMGSPPPRSGISVHSHVPLNLRSSFDRESDLGGSHTSAVDYQTSPFGRTQPTPSKLQQQISVAAIETTYQKFAAREFDTTIVDFADTRLLRNLGFKLIQLRDSRMYSWTDLLNAGFPLTEIKPLRAVAAANANTTSTNSNGMASIHHAGDVSESMGKLASGFKLSVDELRIAGYSIEQCIQAGFDASALRAGGFNELQLVQSGLFTMKQLKKAGCDVQRFALKALYQATNGKHWRKRDGWGSNRPLGEWYGVKLDGAGNVVHIDLRSNELQGM